MDLLNYRCYNNLWTRVQTMCSSRLPSSEISRSGAFQSSPGPQPLIPQRRASAHRLVASNTANTALRSALSRISAVPVSSCASRPPSPCTATSTNLRSNASMICVPSSATELSASSSSRHSDAARAAASTRLRIVSVPCSSAVAPRPSNASRTRTSTRCGRSEGRTSSPWNTTTRLLARDRIASSCSCSMGRTSAVWATLILRWSIFKPSCAISADSMLRTTCFGCVSDMVSTWISLTSPIGVTTTRADKTPVRLAIRFSARFTPHGSGLCAPPVARREVGVAHVRPALERRPPQHLVARLVAELVVHLLEVVQVHEQQGKRLAGAVAARHLARQPVPQHPERGEPRQAVFGRLKLRLRRRLVEVRRTRLEGRALQRRPLRKRLTRPITARTAVPRPPVGREPDLLQHALYLLGTRPALGDEHHERLPHPHALRDRIVHHRLERARGLGRPHDLAAPEQLLPGPEQRMVETPLARQDVHQAQLDAVHGNRPRDPLERPQPPHLAEPLARVALLPQQLERQAPRRAPMPASLLGEPAEVRLLLIDPYGAPPKPRRQVVERDGRIHIQPSLRDAHPRVHHLRPRPVHAFQIARS